MIADILKVFSQSYYENVEVFLTTGRRTTLISCIAMCGYAQIVHIPHTIQVWGIVSFVVVIGLSTTFIVINGESTPHFLILYNRRIGVDTVKEQTFIL